MLILLAHMDEERIVPQEIIDGFLKLLIKDYKSSGAESQSTTSAPLEPGTGPSEEEELSMRRRREEDERRRDEDILRSRSDPSKPQYDGDGQHILTSSERRALGHGPSAVDQEERLRRSIAERDYPLGPPPDWHGE